MLSFLMICEIFKYLFKFIVSSSLWLLIYQVGNGFLFMHGSALSAVGFSLILEWALGTCMNDGPPVHSENVNCSLHLLVLFLCCPIQYWENWFVNLYLKKSFSCVKLETKLSKSLNKLIPWCI